ncbi:MAG: Nicotinate-nucleotide--dimethylbenzimidazole phosphoribosyltransferase, partial [uncultured Rubrobacteraceae bacterium]
GARRQGEGACRGRLRPGRGGGGAREGAAPRARQAARQPRPDRGHRRAPRRDLGRGPAARSGERRRHSVRRGPRRPGARRLAVAEGGHGGDGREFLRGRGGRQRDSEERRRPRERPRRGGGHGPRASPPAQDGEGPARHGRPEPGARDDAGGGRARPDERGGCCGGADRERGRPPRYGRHGHREHDSRGGPRLRVHRPSPGGDDRPGHRHRRRDSEPQNQRHRGGARAARAGPRGPCGRPRGARGAGARGDRRCDPGRCRQRGSGHPRRRHLELGGPRRPRPRPPLHGLPLRRSPLRRAGGDGGFGAPRPAPAPRPRPAPRGRDRRPARGPPDPGRRPRARRDGAPGGSGPGM